MSEESLFHEALSRPAAERTAFLDQACAGQPGLRAAVQALLAAHDASRPFLNRPVVDATTAHTPNPAEAPSLGTIDQRPAIEVGAVIAGRYRLVEKIGEGGMGEVWVAKQSEPVKRKVALKLIKAGMDSKAVLTRFEQERQALALMDHPNIARVLDGGLTELRQPYFVMELVNGLPLTRFCDEARLDVRQRLELFVAICQAVQHAHQKGIVHRDLKPSNILVTLYDGKPVPKVIDFGVAKATSGKLIDESLSTQFGAVVGTLEYMSPEQAGFSAQDVDTRADIYSLGVILYELLTGLKPFDSERLRKAALDQIIRIIREEEPPRPSTRLSSDASAPSMAALRQVEPKALLRLMRGELDWVVMRCLEKQRDRRHETASSLARDVERYLHDEPVEACPPSAGYRLRKLMRRYRTPLRVAAALFFVLIVGIVVSVWQAVRATDAEQVATTERNNAQKASEAEKERAGQLAIALKDTERAEQAEKQRAGQLAVALKEAEKATLLEKATREKAEEDLATSTMMLARSRFEENNAGLANDLLGQVSKKYRGSSWGLLNNQVVGGLFTLHGHTGAVLSVSFSPDGQMLASASLDKTVRLWDARSGQELRVLKGHTGSVQSVSFSPDGQVLASASHDTTVRLWDVKSGQELRVLKGHGRIVWCVTFSPNGEVLASASADNTVRLWNAKSGHELRGLKGHTNFVSSVSFSPDGRMLASASWDKTVRLWDAKSGQELRVLKGHTGNVHSVVFSPDSQVLASASTTVRLWDAKSGHELRVIQAHSSSANSVSFSPDGQVLASLSDDNTVRLWDVRSGQELRAISGHTDHVNCVSFSPNGQVLALAGNGGTVRLWYAKTGQELRVLNGHTRLVHSVSFSPDGQVLASASNEIAVRLWDAKSGQELRVLKVPTGIVSSVSFSPDGQVLATAHSDKTVRLWDVKSGQELRGLKGHAGWVVSVSFSPDGQVLASGSQDKTVRLWNANSGQELGVLKGHADIVSSLSFSPDGQVLASASEDKTVRLWDAKSGHELRVLKGDSQGINSVSFCPDGQVLASASGDHTVLLWDAKTGQKLRAFKGHTNTVSGVSFSPDGKVLASASMDKTVRLWDARSGQELRVLKGHTNAVTSVRFSPDGQVLGSASYDKTVRLWDVRSTWTSPGQPLSPHELAFRRWVTSPVPEWHVEKRQEAEKADNAFATAFHRSWEQHARGVLAIEGGDFNRAYAHFIAAAALKPKTPPSEK